MFRWTGWFDDKDDCTPPEPGKHWIEILDGTDEFCVIVHRAEEFDPIDFVVLDKEERAATLVNLLNAARVI